MIKQALNGILVDDDADDRDFFKAACDAIETDVNLKTFNSCKSLFDCLLVEKYVPDIIFLDINMPTKNGFECLDQIRQHWDMNERCVIMYSTSSRLKDINKCFDFKANGYIQKPYSLFGLKSILKQIFEKDWSDSCENLSKHDFIITPN